MSPVSFILHSFPISAIVIFNMTVPSCVYEYMSAPYTSKLKTSLASDIATNGEKAGYYRKVKLSCRDYMATSGTSLLMAL